MDHRDDAHKGPTQRALRGLRGLWLGQLGPMRAYAPGGNSVRRVARFDPTRETVLLTQGLVQTRGVMEILEARLRRDGFEVFSVHLGGFMGTYNTRPIPVIARHVLGKIRRLRARYGLGRIHMIGHSKGGLIGRYMLQILGGEEHVKTLITLGTPHRGTPTAWLVSAPVLRQIMPSGPEMVPGSEVLEALQGAPMPADTRVVSIFSRTDLICPYWCSWVDPSGGGRVRNLMVQGQGHTELLSDRRVYRLLKAELRPPPGL